jgi:3-oxoacyl-[acyl-carrier protein] reductase
MKLASENTLVTGGTVGLGRAIVEAFLHEGANVLFCARDGEAVAAVECELRASLRDGQKLVGVACDVSRAEEVDSMFQRFDQELGPLHALVNNAGINGPKGATESVDWRDFTRTIEINLYGTVLTCRAAISRMKTLGGGKIVNFSGGGATAPLPRFSAYAASKAAVVRLTETLAEELRDFHIEVNAIAPGAVNTRMFDEMLQAGPELVGEAQYRKLLRQADEGGVPPEKAAQLCVFLASAASDGLTGKLISAQWDPVAELPEHLEDLAGSDIYTLRRIVPGDRGKTWGS